MSLIDKLIQQKWLKTDRIIQALREIDRKDFLPEEMHDLAQQNTALPIGYNQTISQPLTVVFMLELLQPKPGEKILDIGSGSGWTTALLAQIVGSNGKVIAIEIIPELVEFGKKNVLKYNFIKKGVVEFVCGNGSKGYKKEAPYDKILVSAAVHPPKFSKGKFGRARKVSEEWKEQLKIKGRIVVPVKTSIWLLEKISENEFKQSEYPGFMFVPLIEKNN